MPAPSLAHEVSKQNEVNKQPPGAWGHRPAFKMLVGCFPLCGSGGSPCTPQDQAPIPVVPGLMGFGDIGPCRSACHCWWFLGTSQCGQLYAQLLLWGWGTTQRGDIVLF